MNIRRQKFENFDVTSVEFDTNSERLRYFKIIEIIYEFTLTNSLGLDIGSGKGKISRILNKDYRIINIDPNRFNSDKPTIQSCSEYLPFKNNKFDFIILSNVLAHLNDLPSSMGEINRVLKPKGFVFASQSNRIGWRRIMSFHIMKSDRSYHYRAFTKWELWNLFSKAGLCPIDIRIAFWFYFHSKFSEFCHHIDQKGLSKSYFLDYAPSFNLIARKIENKDCSLLNHPNKIKFVVMFIFAVLISFLIHGWLILLIFRNKIHNLSIN